MANKVQQQMIAQHEKIRLLRSQLVDAVAAAAKATDTAERNLQTVLDEERQRASVDRQHLIAQITSLINNTAGEQERRLTERIDDVRSDMTHTQVKLGTASLDYEDRMDVWARREQKFYSELCDAKNTVRCVLSNDWQVCRYFSCHPFAYN
jgi:kinesin family protein 11